MNRYILWINKWRKPLIILFVVSMIFAILGIRRIQINARFDIFKLVDSEHQQVLEEMNDLFGDSNQTLLMIESTKDAYLKDIEMISHQLKQSKTSFTSPLDIFNLIPKGSLEEKIDAMGNMSPIIFKEDKVYTTFSLSVNSDYDFNALEESVDIAVYFSGDAYMQYTIISLITSIVMAIPPLALFLVLMTFRSQLSSFKAALLSVLPAAIGAIWTVGLAGWIGGELSIVTVLSPIFAIVIGSADGLHFISHMEDSDKDRLSALSHTLELVGMPLIITTTTSIAGFLGLMMINTTAIKELALFASVGIFLAGLATWYVLPLILTGNIQLRKKEKFRYQSGLMKLWGKKSIVTVLILLIGFSAFIPSINTEFNQLMFFKSYTKVQKSFEKILSVNDGALPFYFFGKTDMTNRDATIKELKLMLDDLEDYPAVSHVINPLNLIDNSQNINMSTASQFIHIKNNEVYYRMLIFPKDFNNDTINALYDETAQYNLDGQIAGVQLLMKEMNESIVASQLRSILITFILIIAMLLFSLRSIKLTFIASLPIVITSIILYGFLGLTQIPLNLMTAMIFSISLGIGIDYAIHYTSIYKYHLDHKDQDARELALKYTARPIIANAFGLSLGLTALWLSPLRIHFHISSLMWVAMMTSVFLSLTLIPTLLQKRDRATR